MLYDQIKVVHEMCVKGVGGVVSRHLAFTG
jgi:hypothetical protein